MPIPEDVLSAKRVVSELLLRPIAVASAPAAFELSVGAGPPSGIANHIAAVLDELQITLT